MKATFTFAVEERTHMFMSCPRCNGIHWQMIEQIEPKTETPFHMECRKCHLETEDYQTEKEAEAAWVNLIQTYNGEEWHGEV